MTVSGAIGLDELTGGGPVVVLAPHADDESLGCGGMLAALCAGAATAHPHVVCMTNGCASHPRSKLWDGPRLARQRRDELARALDCLGAPSDRLVFLDHPDGRLGEADADVVADTIARLCDLVGARALFSASGVDHHEDHKATARIARLVRARRPQLSLWFYPVWSRWDDPDFASAHAPALPRIFDASPWKDRKRRAIDAHESQLGRVVADDPSGFAMEPRFVDRFVEEPEYYFEDTPCR